MTKRRNSATDEVVGGAIRHNYIQPCRDDETVKDLQKKLNRAIGRLDGIKKMVDANRYSSEILMQVAAVQSMLRQFECAVLSDYMKNCAVPEVVAGHDEVLDEFDILVKTIR